MKGKGGPVVVRFRSLIVAWLVIAMGLVPLQAGAECFRVASWNVENLFDLSYEGTEYPGYVPRGAAGWDKQMLEEKLNNLCRVIADMSPDILGLQEVESEKALGLLQRSLRRAGESFPFAVIAGKKPTTVKCALLSKYPVTSFHEVRLPGKGARSILQADIDISGNELTIFVNHWKSKSGPESLRIAYARALASAAGDLPESSDYLFIGDFNSNHNEFQTIKNRSSLNDTGGKTGINHVLKTVSKRRPVGEEALVKRTSKGLHYNLWFEIPQGRRWSSLFFGRPASPDAILLPAALYDGKGISYVDNSFEKFDPGYVFDRGRLFRWQRADSGRGRHLGRGFSDHLPVYAHFTDSPFEFSESCSSFTDQDQKTLIADLYKSRTGGVSFKLMNCAVIYRHGTNAVIKQKNGRAVYVYKEAEDLEKGGIYNITVSRLKRYYGNLEITGIESFKRTGGIRAADGYYIEGPDKDLSDPALENEVIGQYCGVYKNKGFYYGNGKQIRLYFRDGSFAPESGCRICIRNARIGFHRSPELVIEKNKQIKRIKSE